MTTKRQIKKLLQPIADRHDDLVRFEYCIVMKPLRHVLRSIWIYRRRNANLFRPFCLVSHMFTYTGAPSGRDSDMFPRQNRDIIWDHDDPRVAGELLYSVENCTIPFMRKMEDLDVFLKHTRSPVGHGAAYFGRLPYRNFLREVGAGDFDAAMTIYGKGFDMSVYVSPRDSPSYKQYYADVQASIDRLAPLVAAGDRFGVGDVLRDMERVTARKLGMEHLWEPTPFPFEASERAV